MRRGGDGGSSASADDRRRAMWSRPPSPHPLIPSSPHPVVISGRRPVLEALRAGRPVRRLWLAEGLRAAPVLVEIAQLAEERGLAPLPATRQELDRRTDGANHQGVAAECAPRADVDLDELLAVAELRGEPALLVAVDRLEDPQNLGSLIRSAEAAGAHGLLLPRRRSAGMTAAVERASAGAAAHLPVAKVVNLSRALERLKAAGLWVAGLDEDGRTRYDRADLAVPLVLVVGGEGRGLSRLVAEHCDLLLSLPMAGQVASLNAAVAGAIVLFEAVRQRRADAARA